MPLAAVIHWQSPALRTPLLPMESRAPSPSFRYITVSNPRWGCHGRPGTPLGVLDRSELVEQEKRVRHAVEEVGPPMGRLTTKPAPSFWECALNFLINLIAEAERPAMLAKHVGARSFCSFGANRKKGPS